MHRLKLSSRRSRVNRSRSPQRRRTLQRRRSPSPQRRSPSPQRRSPSPQRRSPSPQRRSPQLRRSPSPRGIRRLSTRSSSIKSGLSERTSSGSSREGSAKYDRNVNSVRYNKKLPLYRPTERVRSWVEDY